MINELTAVVSEPAGKKSYSTECGHRYVKFEKESLFTRTNISIRSDRYQIYKKKLIMYELGPGMLGFPHIFCWKIMGYEFVGRHDNNPKSLREEIELSYQSFLDVPSDRTASGWICPKKHSYSFVCLPLEKRVTHAQYYFQNHQWSDWSSVKTTISLPEKQNLKHPASRWVQKMYEEIRKELDVDSVHAYWEKEKEELKKEPDSEWTRKVCGGL